MFLMKVILILFVIWIIHMAAKNQSPVEIWYVVSPKQKLVTKKFDEAPTMIYEDSLWMEEYVEQRVDEIQGKIAMQGCPFTFYVGDITEIRQKMMLEWILTLPTTKSAYLNAEFISGMNF